MKHSRVNGMGKLDVGRLSAAIAGPGTDTRIWVSLCIVDKVVIDGDGVFADVHIMSTASIDDDGSVYAQQETVRVAPDYAGNGFGIWTPLDQGDEVLVTWPDGHPDHGGILVKRLYSASDPPPDLAQNNPADVLLIAKKDVNVRIITQGQGNIVIATDQGKVMLGDEEGPDVDPPPQPVARKTDPVDLGTFTVVGAGIAFTGINWFPPGTDLNAVPPPTPTQLLPGTPVNLIGAVKDGSKKVEST